MTLKKIYNGHYRRVPSGSRSSSSDFTDSESTKRRKAHQQYLAETNEEKKMQYGILDNVLYGAGIGIGAIGLALALVSSTVLASTLLLSTYLCVNTCGKTEEDALEVEYS